jgi:hypothetical protein
VSAVEEDHVADVTERPGAAAEVVRQVLLLRRRPVAAAVVVAAAAAVVARVEAEGAISIASSKAHWAEELAAAAVVAEEAAVAAVAAAVVNRFRSSRLALTFNELSPEFKAQFRRVETVNMAQRWWPSPWRARMDECRQPMSVESLQEPPSARVSRAQFAARRSRGSREHRS